MVNYYYLADHLGSIVQESSAAGAITLEREYDPWGVAMQGASTSGYAYTGREWDAEVNLYDYRSRYYEPNSGQFINEDPIGLLGGQSNLLRYVGNRPTGAIDPFGLCSGQPDADQDPDTVVREYMKRIRNAPDEETRERVLRELFNDPNVKVSEAGMSGARRLALEAAKRLLGRQSGLFGTRGVLNSGRNLRIGHSRDSGDGVFRIAGDWVEKYVPQVFKTPDGKHIVIKNLGPLGKE